MEKYSDITSFSLSSLEDKGNTPQVKDEWARANVLRNRSEIDQIGAKQRDIEVILSKLFESKEWNRPKFTQPVLVFSSIEIPSNIRMTFGKLEEDFSDFSNRIVWCSELKNCLSDFEDELEDYDAKYLSWFVSTLQDVFSYNYAETITEEQLLLLKDGIDTIYEKQEDCDKDSFEEYHFQLIKSGLSLLPTTQKAIDEFGE